MFAMLGATTTGGLVPFAILYGCFSGCCEFAIPPSYLRRS